MNMCDEISNEAYKKIMIHCKETEEIERFPDNVTNGDVIKAMFPSYVFYDCGLTLVVFQNSKDYRGYVIEFDKDWWNAPYKTESADIIRADEFAILKAESEVIPIDPPKLNVDINHLPEMERDPIGEEIERQYKLRAAELKAESEEV